jgi:hypothetical protein
VLSCGVSKVKINASILPSVINYYIVGKLIYKFHVLTKIEIKLEKKLERGCFYGV